MEEVSIITGKINKLGVLDYLVFASILVISCGIGFYHAWKDRHKQTVSNVLLAGRNMHPIPVALSLVASFMSAITLLGVPVEMYSFSTMYFWIGLGYFLVMAGAAHIYTPMFYMLKVTSVYEVLYMSIVLYAPSLALNAVTGFNLWGSIGSVAAVCTIYTAFGGMKAVLWTDCFQLAIMLIGYLAVLIRGSIKVGGISVAWERMEKSGRVHFTDFSPDPSVRHSVWSLVIGAYFTWVAIYGVNQSQVQRACACLTLERAQVAFWLNVPGLWSILYLGCLIGIVVFGFYHDCDPLTAGLISSRDQILPLFVMDVLGDLPGLPGLFTACLFSAALSTVSSGLNSVAACVVEDMIRGHFIKNLTDLRATQLTKVVALVAGVVCFLLTIVASYVANILQAALSIFGMIAGPLLGVFTLGLMFPWANKWGAVSGLFTSLILMFWIGGGAFMESPTPKPKPPGYVISGCLFRNVTTPKPKPPPPRTALHPLYTLSYIWYGFYSVLTVCVVGLIVSFITVTIHIMSITTCRYTQPSSLDPRFICPIFDILPPFRFLPESLRKPLRFGIVHEDKYVKVLTDEEVLQKLMKLTKMSMGELFNMTLEVTPGNIRFLRPTKSINIISPEIDMPPPVTLPSRAVEIVKEIFDPGIGSEVDEDTGGRDKDMFVT